MSDRADRGRFATWARALGARLGGTLGGLLGQSWWLLPVTLAGLLLIGQRTTDIEPFRIQQLSAMPCVPEESLDWTTVRLPLSRYGDCWLLRTPIDADALELRGAGLLMMGLHQDAAVFINGAQVRDMPWLEGQTYYSSSLWLAIGSGMLQPGSNELLIELRSEPGSRPWVSLAGLAVGPRDVLEQRQIWHERLQRDGARLALVLGFAVLLFVLPIAISRPREPLYRWFALSLVCASLYVSHFATELRLVGPAPWAWLMHSALAVSLWSLAQVSSRMMARPAARWWNLGVVVALLAMLFIQFPTRPSPMVWIGDSLYRLILLAMTVHLAWYWWQGRELPIKPDGRWFAAAVLLQAWLGCSDSLRAILRGQWATHGYSLHWAILYVTLLIFVALLVRILQALRDAERSSEQLAQELAERSRELDQEFERRRAAEAARTLADERQRIMRDMHDGVGGQLVALIAQVQSAPPEATLIVDNLRRTLDELRLMIDSLDEACADLSVALGMFRARMEALLNQYPVRIRWRTAHLPDLPPVAPSTVLQVLRILQEALTNALKHAGSAAITVAADWDGAHLQIEVCDDGVGGLVEHSGRGLASMRGRAQAIGAELRIEDNRPGVRVCLLLTLIKR